MAATRIDLGQERESSREDVSGLKSPLAQLVGEPFQFVVYRTGRSRPCTSAS